MKKLFFLALIFLSISSYAQQVRLKEKQLLPASIQWSKQDNISSKNCFNLLFQKYAVDKDYQFQLYKTEQDDLGYTHYRYKQYYKNILVDYSMYLLHQRENYIYMANGDSYAIKNNQSAATISEQTALTKALQVLGANQYYWQQDTSLIPENYAKYKTQPKAQLVWAPYKGDFTKADFHLCYKFEIYAVQPFGRYFVYIDANTGDLIWKLNAIIETNVNGTAITKFSGTRTFQTDSLSATSYRLKDTSRGQGVFTKNKHTTTNTSSLTEFTDADNYWNNVNAQKDEVATDVHWGTQKVYDYYFNTYGRDSYDDAGGTLYGYVHHGVNYVNAFWDGTSMNYGDGNATYKPLTCLDIVAHELTHGVTEYSANLVYQDESGALNESFSDIFGNTIEKIEKPLTANWKIAEELTSNGAAFRNMANPNQYGDPDTYNGTNWYTGTADNGGVHTNSGVQNFWFYILTEGDTATNDLNNAYSVPGIGLTKAAAIAYRNLSVYLTSNSQYADARFYAIQAASDLFGPCSPEVIQTTNAWYAVGVGAAYSNVMIPNFDALPTNSCNIPATIQFTNTGNNVASAFWTFGDGGTSNVLNPSHVYNTAGIYTVKMVATSCNNVVDSITIPNYIVIDSNSVFCDTTQMPNTGTITINDCAGVLVDNGGAYGNYLNNVTTNIRVTSPPLVSHYQVQFVKFGTELNYDYVKLYDGTNTTAPLIGNYTGGNLPNNGNWMNTTDTVFYLRLQADQALNDEGFVMKYQCIYIPPTANFYSADTNTCTGNVNFVNTSSGANSYIWYFGDGNTSTATNPSHSYASAGTYTVTLVAYNGTAPDTLIKNAYIVYNPTSLNCNAYLQPTSGTNTISNICQGNLFDDGGNANNYSANINNSHTIINGQSGQEIKLNFINYSLGSGDTLRIYDGNSTTAPLLCKLSSLNASLPNGGKNIWSSSNVIMIEFQSNASVQAAGFYLKWQCALRNDSTNFTKLNVDTIDYCKNLFAFDQSGLIPSNIASINLFTGDGNNVNLSSPANYTYAVNGNFNLRLEMKDAGSTYYEYDNLITDRVFASATIPSTAFANQTVTFTNSSINGSNASWFSNSILLGTGSPYNTVFTAPGTYAIDLVADNGTCSDTFSQNISISVAENVTNTLQELGLQVYPNPASKTLFIESSKQKMQQIILSDKSGKIILNKKADSYKETLSLESLARGMYNIKIVLSDQSVVVDKVMLVE